MNEIERNIEWLRDIFGINRYRIQYLDTHGWRDAGERSVSLWVAVEYLRIRKEKFPPPEFREFRMVKDD